MGNSETVNSISERRSVLKLGAGLLATSGLAFMGALPARAAPTKRVLSFYNLHTSERLKVTYWANGSHIPDALAEINHVLRDFRTDETKPIDVRLLDLLHSVRQSIGTEQPYHIISGYRSPATNAKLAKRSRNIARRSMHLVGKAIDVRLPGQSLRTLHKAAVAHKSGGVGFYPESNFVHLDVGRVRYW